MALLPQDESISALPSFAGCVWVSGPCPTGPPKLAAPTPLCRHSLNPEQTLTVILLQTFLSSSPKISVTKASESRMTLLLSRALNLVSLNRNCTFRSGRL